MRSRDGSNYFLFTIFFYLVLSNSLALDASEYLISYRYVVRDAILYDENLQISHAMKKCRGDLSEILFLKNYIDRF